MGKLNVTKSQVVCTEGLCPGEACVTPEARYLGIKIRMSLVEIVEVNWVDILASVRSQLERVECLHLSMVG